MSRDPFPNEPDRVHSNDLGSPFECNEAGAREISGTIIRDSRGTRDQKGSFDARRAPESDDSARAHYLRDRTYLLRESEFATLVEIGKFRVIGATDLAEFGYGGDTARMNRDVRRMERQGLIARRSLESASRGTEQVLVLTRKAQRLIFKSGRLPEGQAIYHGLVRPREARHDAQLYRLYQRQSAKIESAGGRPLRVVLDYELMRKLHRDLASMGEAGRTREVRERLAEKHGLALINDKVQIPDLRLEYETADYEPRHVNLELATRNYRPGALTEKAKAGFFIYAPREDVSKLRRILDEPELMARILSL